MNYTHIIHCFRLYIVEVWKLTEDVPKFNSCANITKGIFTHYDTFNTDYPAGKGYEFQTRDGEFLVQMCLKGCRKNCLFINL